MTRDEAIEVVARAMVTAAAARADEDRGNNGWELLGFSSLQSFIDGAWPNYREQAAIGYDAGLRAALEAVAGLKDYLYTEVKIEKGPMAGSIVLHGYPTGRDECVKAINSLFPEM
jgi:hypothetical protein